MEFEEHKAKCTKDGLKREDIFTKVMERENYEVLDATEKQNIEDHIDKICINKSGKRFTVDVKKRKDFTKCLKRYPDAINWNILEFTNVSGKKGWLQGKADYIAFEIDDSFVFVPLPRLREFAYDTSIISPLRVEEDKEHYLLTVCEAFHKIHRRKGQHDLITVVHNNELKQLADKIIKI